MQLDVYYFTTTHVTMSRTVRKFSNSNEISVIFVNKIGAEYLK